MDAGLLRQQDARLLILTSYSTVVGLATEVEVLRALGVEPTPRALLKQRAGLLDFLRAALVPPDSPYSSSQAVPAGP
jgi:TetR/AcrR family transcriptional regulator